MFKKVLFMSMILGTLVMLSACRTNTDSAGEEMKGRNLEKTTLRVAALMGPTGMGMVELMDKAEKGEGMNHYDFTIMASPDDLVGKIIRGEVDVAAVPSNLASVLYNRTDGAVQIAGVNTLGVLYLLENGDAIKSIEDLRGKTVAVSGKGATPEYVLNYLLQENGLIPDVDVILDYKLQHGDLAAAMVAGDVDIALLPEPHVTTVLMRNEKVRIALDVTEEWQKITQGSSLPMGAIIVQRDFVSQNKEAFDSFLEEVQQSVAFVNNEREQASEWIVKYNILPNENIALKSIPGSNIVWIEAKEAKESLEQFYQILVGFAPNSVGGQLADEGFYYER
jgi:NitT/TauT family transport system substrate-binding protein